MHLEHLEYDRATRALTHERIGDEGIFSGARVEWRGCQKSDLAWIHEQLDRALAAWTATTTDALDHARFRLTGTASPQAIHYALAHAAPDGTWIAAAPWEQLDEPTQRTILDAIDEVLATINALLLIYD